MERSNYRIFLDIQESHGACVLDMKQTDTHRRLRITLTEGGKHYPVPDSCYPVFTAKKPDGTVIYNLCATEQGDVIYDITPQTTAAPGLLSCEIRLLDTGGPLLPNEQGILPEADAQLLTSAAFGIRVHPTVYNENVTLASATEVSALSGAVAQAQATVRALTEAREAGLFDGQSATHSWNGSVLTVTSASGTSSADLQGPKGDKGDKGDPGPQGEPGIVNIDDSTVGSSAWSGKNIIERLCPSFHTQGYLVQCTPVEGYPLQVYVCGADDPDTTHAYYTLCGKNLYDPVAYPMVPKKMIRHTSGNYAESTAFSATEKYIPAAHLQGKTISIRNAPKVTSPGGTNAGIAFYDINKAYISGSSDTTVTVPNNTFFLRFSVDTQHVKEAQIELGGEVTKYEAYQGRTVTADYVPSDGATEFAAVAPSGVSTLYGYVGIVKEEGFVPVEVGHLIVTGRADPVAIFEKLTQTVRSLGGNM